MMPLTNPERSDNGNSGLRYGLAVSVVISRGNSADRSWEKFGSAENDEEEDANSILSDISISDQTN